MELAPRPQRRRDAPRLSGAAARRVRRVAVEYLADVANAVIVDVICQRAQIAGGCGRVAEHAIVRDGKRAEQPRPGRSLVIGGVALKLVAAVEAVIVVLVRRKGSQSTRDDQL